MSPETLDADEDIRASFCAVFRLAPPGSELYLPQSSSWCTSIATKVGRKIKTQVCVAHAKRGGSVVEITKVTFLDERKRKKPAPFFEDPRQILVPGLEPAT